MVGEESLLYEVKLADGLPEALGVELVEKVTAIDSVVAALDSEVLEA